MVLIYMIMKLKERDDNMDITRPTYMEIDLNNLEHNIKVIQEKVGQDVKLMPVIKANGYGTYINQRLDILNKFEIVAVAIVDEGIYLRNLGYQKEIFILNQPYITEIPKIIKYNLVVGISSYDFANELAKTKKDITVHLEIGTGMGRTGIHPYKIEKFIDNLANNIKVEGLYTHFSSADNDDEYTKKQLTSFKIAITKAEAKLGKIKYLHTAASNAILNYPATHFNLVRPGIILYGYPGEEDTYQKINLKPIAKLKSTITFLKIVEEGTSIGYGRSYITDKETKVATIPLGYADGFRRTFSNGWRVLINNKLVPIIGKICMDSFMVDVTDIKDVKVGDEVIIWDNQNITLDDLANKCDTINYEILSTISSRVPRKFIK